MQSGLIGYSEKIVDRIHLDLDITETLVWDICRSVSQPSLAGMGWLLCSATETLSPKTWFFTIVYTNYQTQH